jgi:hypothetical protein
MPVIPITQQAIDCDPLREERHELLTAVADESAHVRHRRYLARLISNRLREIEEKMKALGCPSNPDVAEVAEIINELDDLNRE